VGRETDHRLGWQGWLWLTILAVCLAALALGLGFRYGTVSAEGSADLTASDGGGSAADVPDTIGPSPASTSPRSPATEPGRATGGLSGSGVVSPFTSTSVAGIMATTVAGSSPDSSSSNRAFTSSTTTSRPGPSSTTTNAPTTISVTTSRSSAISTTTAAAEAVRRSSIATPPTSSTTSTTAPTTTTTRWSGPVAVDDRLAVDEGKEAKPEVLANDAPGDAPLDENTLSITAGPANAKSYKVHDDHLHYRPADGFTGVDRIRYRICDDAGRCDTATVTITVG